MPNSAGPGLNSMSVNGGGPASLVSLTAVPVLETEVLLGREGAAALALWRARPGEIFTVVDPEQGWYRARLLNLEADGAVVVPFTRLPRPAESPLAIEVYQVLPEKERFELILQKLTEIGVHRIAPCISRRSITLQERDAGQKKSHRWPEVLLRAARQCRRGMIPELMPVLTWEETLDQAQHADLKLILYEGEAPWTLREVLAKDNPQCIALLVGPEGGFAEAEVAEAQQQGFLPVSIGPRIFRTETAAIVGAALLQFAAGDLD